MPDKRETKFLPFTSHGLLLKSDPALIPDGYYQELENLVSTQEGSLTTRNGNLYLTGTGTFGGETNLHSIARLNLGGESQSELVRYVGAGQNIWRSSTQIPQPASGPVSMSFSEVATGVSPSGDYTAQRWNTADYNAGDSSTSFKFFACPNGMVKDNGTMATLQNWGILPPPRPVVFSAYASGSGPGGPNAISYVITYRNPVTGYESNPSSLMLTAINPGTSPNQGITITVYGSSDPQVTGENSLGIYRSGGAFSDGLYRLVTYIANPGATPTSFTDNFQDADIASNQLLASDNDPPVPSPLPSPLSATFNWVGAARTGLVTLQWESTQSGPSIPLNQVLRVGTTITINPGSAPNSPQETAIIETTIDGSNTLTVYLQNTYSTSTASVYCDTVTAAPATLALSALGSLFIAGNPLAPSTLYMSKGGSPEAFPVVELSTNIPKQIQVGSPQNPIVAIAEFEGSIVCLNLDSIFVVVVTVGYMQAPVRTPAQRGLLSSQAWCQTDNEIWYLSYDGIYSWSGGQSVWRSEEIDPLFRGLTIGPYAPIDLVPGKDTSGADVCAMMYANNEVFLVCMDTTGKTIRLRYHTLFKRWSMEYIGDPAGLVSIQAVYADTANSEILMTKKAGAGAFLYLDNVGETDGWTSSPTDGTPIAFACLPGTISAPPQIDKLFSDLLLEASASSTATVACYYDYATTANPTDTFTFTSSTRTREPFSLQQGQGKQGYAIATRISGSGVVTLYSLAVNYTMLTQYTVGMAYDWDDLGWPWLKTLRALDIEVDTGGVAASLQIQGDGVNLGSPLSITTTSANRNRIISLPANTQARMLKIVPIPGSGGYWKEYKHQFVFAKEPADLTFWDSLEMTFGYNGYSSIKQIWIEYVCAEPITVALYSDGNTLFYKKTLPAQPSPERGVQRFYLPSANNGVLNKSKTHRLTLSSTESTAPVRFYKDSSRIEFMLCGSDMRSAYKQATLSELMAPSI